MRRTIVDWIGAIGTRPPDWVRVEKGHGRLEQRSLWMQPCGELSAYLQERFAWPGAQWCGWIERKRKRLADSQEEISQQVWIAGAAFPLQLTAEQVLLKLRRHWAIENGVFRVRDVTYDEDRLHGRKIGLGLSSLRNAALTLLRRYRYPYIPDAQRAVAARPDLAFALLETDILEL